MPVQLEVAGEVLLFVVVFVMVALL